MKFIYPHAIDLVYTSVPADSSDEWSAATTYALNAIVKRSTSVPNKVYKSLRSNNLNRTPENWLEPVTEFASSTTSIAVETGNKTFTVETGKSFSPGMEVNVTRTTTPRSVSMSSEVVSYNSSTGELVLSIYSVVGSGTYATWTLASADEIGFWEEVGTTNAHAMFDEYVNTITSNSSSIFLRLETSGADGLAFFNVSASRIDIDLWDETETTKIWEGSIDMVYSASLLATVSDWYEYFLGEYTVKNDAYIEIPIRMQDAIMTISIVAPSGGNATCGQCIIGTMTYIGGTQYNPSAGMIDYSERTEDSYGKISVTPGYWGKRISVNLIIDNASVDHVYKKLVSMRGIPTAWIGNNDSTDYEMLTLFGIFDDFDITVPGPTKSYCSLGVKGLI